MISCAGAIMAEKVDIRILPLEPDLISCFCYGSAAIGLSRVEHCRTDISRLRVTLMKRT